MEHLHGEFPKKVHLFPETLISCRMPRCSNQRRGSSLKFFFACCVTTSLALSNMPCIGNQLWLILDLEKSGFSDVFQASSSDVNPSHCHFEAFMSIHQRYPILINSGQRRAASGGARCSGGDESSEGGSSGRGGRTWSILCPWCS